MLNTALEYLKFAAIDLPRCAYLGAYYVINGPVEPSSAQAITEIVARVMRKRIGREYDAYLETPLGRQRSEERSDLAAILDDHEALAKMPEGSLGRVYLDAMNGMMGADGDMMAGAADFTKMLQVEDVCGRFGWPDEHIWFMRRNTLTHDITHVMTGYGTDITGEFANIAYTAAHLKIPALLPMFGVLFLASKPTTCTRRELYRYLKTAYARGKAQRESLVLLDYETLLPLQVDEVVRRMGLEPYDEAHPDGPIIDGLGIGVLVKESDAYFGADASSNEAN